MKTIKKITVSVLIATALIASITTFKSSKQTFREFKSCLKENTGTNYSAFINDFIY